MNERNQIASRSFVWTKPKRRVAAMLATDELRNKDIAARVGITERTIYLWLEAPEFRAEVSRLSAIVADRILAYGIARLENRVAAQNDRWYRMRQVIEDRAADPEMATIPGGQTGLMVKTLKVIGQGPFAQTVEEYAVDTGLLKELREHEKQAAQELGQWTEKRETSVSGSLDVPIRAIVVNVPASLAHQLESGD